MMRIFCCAFLYMYDAPGCFRSSSELSMTDVLSRLRFSDTWRFDNAQRGGSICLSSGEICPVANTRHRTQSPDKTGSSAHQLSLRETNKINHFLSSLCTSFHHRLQLWQRQSQDERNERSQKRGGKWGREIIPLYKCRVQSFQVWTFFSRFRLLPWQSYLKVLVIS